MGKLRPKEILKRVERDGFEHVWRESGYFLPPSQKRLILSSHKQGDSHPLFDVLHKLRRLFLDFGFMEVSNPIIVDETEVYKQYGPEAPVILDRCYYLATLPRPDIGLSRDKRQQIERMGIQMTKEKTGALRGVLRDYKTGKIAGDDFIENLADVLAVSDSTATQLLSEVFPEFTSLKPKPSTLTLRSHMTSAWFLTLQALQRNLDVPIRLFSVDIRFRREQSEDSTHLRAHYTASCVIMDDDVNVADGEEVTKAILQPLGLQRFRFDLKRVTSKYYSPGTEYEGFIFHQKMDKWIEVSNYGLYNPIALARYDLEHPVLNVGIGVERVALSLYNETDMRRLVYPQFHVKLELSDAEIAKMVRVHLEPQTREGLKIRDAIKLTALQHADEPSPCEFLAYVGKLTKKRVNVYVYEEDDDAKLLGPAACNSIYVYGGNILGIPKSGMEHISLVREAREKGVPVGFGYLDALASLAARKIEEAIQLGQEDVTVRVKMAKHPSDINIKISDVARRFITSKKNKIELVGPIFVGVRAEITD